VGFEPTAPASERAKTVDVLARSATVTGKSFALVNNSSDGSPKKVLSPVQEVSEYKANESTILKTLIYYPKT
jgi:hypothetical protein